MGPASTSFVQLALQQTPFMRPTRRQITRFTEWRTNQQTNQFRKCHQAHTSQLPKPRPTMTSSDTKDPTGSSDAATKDPPPNFLNNSTHLLRAAWQAAIKTSGSKLVIDATAGRGSDTLTLCQQLGAHGTVHAFDIQISALAETRARHEVMENQSNIAKLHTHHACHSEIASRTGAGPASMACVAYNLGWYPGRQADRSVVTRPETTVESLTSASGLIAPGGVISIMAYVGHPGGADEESAVLLWCSSLDSRLWTVAHLTYPNRKQAPILLLCQRSLTS